MVHTLSDVIALLVIADHDSAALVVDAVLGVVVPDALDGVPSNLDVVNVRVGGDFSCEHHQASVGQGFSSDTAFGILGKNRVQNGVRDLVGHFVGMSF